jgi:hypothetical protein
MHVDAISEAILAQLGRFSVRAYDCAEALGRVMVFPCG